MWTKLVPVFAVYVALSNSFSIEAGWGGSNVAPGPRCTTELDEVWEEKCETVYLDKCSVNYKQECRPTTEQRCSVKEEPVCQVVSEQKCSSIPVPRCAIVQDRVCTNVPSCSFVHEKVCDLVSHPVCRVEYDQVCTETVEKRCKQVPVPVESWPSTTIDPWVSAPVSGGLKGLLISKRETKGKGGKGKGIWKRSASDDLQADYLSAAEERVRRDVDVDAAEDDADVRAKRSFKGEKGWSKGEKGWSKGEKGWAAPAPSWSAPAPTVQYTTECWDEPRQRCKQVPNKVCTDVQKEVCKNVPNKVCTEVEKCKNVPRKECTTDYKEHCITVPNKQCTTVARDVCINVPSKECREVPFETCTPVPDKSCQKLLVKRPRQVCLGPQRTRKLPEGHESSSIAVSEPVLSSSINSLRDADGY